MKRTETITVTYEDHGNPIDDDGWGYHLRMGGVDVDDDDVRVRRRLGTKTPEPKVHYGRPDKPRTACGRHPANIATTDRHADVDCLSCRRTIRHYPTIFPDGDG